MRVALVLSTLLFLWPGALRAQGVSDAEVLPQGVGAFLIQPGITYGNGALERFGRGWQTRRESLIADYNGIDLTEVFLGDAAADSDLLPKFGKTGFEGQQTSVAFNFMAAFGITDRLTLVGVLPFMHVDYTLDAYLTPDPDNQSNGRLLDSKDLTCPGGNFDLTKLPLNFDEEDYGFNVADLNRALASPCLGYKAPVSRFERTGDVTHGYGDHKYTGFRDLILGAKYQFFHGRHFNLAGLSYVVLPTGSPDDPDDLFDPAFGDGQTDVALLAAVTVPLGDFRFAMSAGYEYQFGDSIERRLNSLTFDDELETQLARGEISERELLDRRVDDGTLVPVVTVYDKAEVKRKLGDNIYVYSYVSYSIFEWLWVGASLNFLHHFRDEVLEIGPRPENTAPYLTEAQVRADVEARIASGELPETERETTLKEGLANTAERRKAAYGWRTVRGNLVGGLSVGVNTVPMFLRDEFPLPLILSVSISRNLAGQNLDTPDAVQAQIVIPFAIGDVLDPGSVAYDGEEGAHLPWP
jgi:hypothetical protein